MNRTQYRDFFARFATLPAQLQRQLKARHMAHYIKQHYKATA